MQNQEIKYAGFWIRTGASIVDTILLLFITLPLLILFYGSLAFFYEPKGLVEGPADFIISYVLPAILTLIFWIYKQATPGKMLVSIKIVDAKTGQPASTAQLIGRYFAYFVSIIPLGLGVLWIAFDKRKQGWHDKLSGTVVIKK